MVFTDSVSIDLLPKVGNQSSFGRDKFHDKHKFGEPETAFEIVSDLLVLETGAVSYARD